MAELPDNVAVASGFLPVPSAIAWALVADISRWPEVFPEWIARVEQDDDRFTATGPSREKFDLYPHADEAALTLDVETVDELGSADTMRLRIVDVAGGSAVTIAHGRLLGTSDASWDLKRSGIQSGLLGLSVS